MILRRRRSREGPPPSRQLPPVEEMTTPLVPEGRQGPRGSAVHNTTALQSSRALRPGSARHGAHTFDTSRRQRRPVAGGGSTHT
eukprot:7340797-Pyramimonas_sp.AAC.1